MKIKSWSVFKSIVDSKGLQIQMAERSGRYDLMIFESGSCYVHALPKNGGADQVDFETNYKPQTNASFNQKVEVKEQTPFAKPDYRTKRDATASWVAIQASESIDIDFKLLEERYVTGGEIIFKNAKEGDYITACVYDKDGVIPEAYRAATCENHPIVAEYVPKKWIKPTDSYGSFEIDTYPLNAKISPNLYLRVVYHASAEAGERKCAINYHLTKKIT